MAMAHQEKHPLAGKTVKLNLPNGHVHIDDPVNAQYRIEDWWDRIVGKSWMDCDGNPACLVYATRPGLPIDNEVVYGKVGWFGHLIHVSELGDVIS